MPEMTRKVACLYRVSTKTQMDKDDIPMQRKACNAFVKTKSFWTITKEYMEKGVSGYHKSAEERDAIIEVKHDAAEKKFDILLVFMFDRLGRREDETTFVVEWLVHMGIEVWSVTEGRQVFENRTDKLINYLRYWQSGGESEKTSLRVAEKQRQMIKEGKYCGGSPPYGYWLILSGELSRDGRELKMLAIDDNASEAVRKMFALCTDPNYGCTRIADYLNKEKVRTKSGKPWIASTVRKIIQNPAYKGYMITGKTKSKRGYQMPQGAEQWIYSDERLEHLVIIDDETWDTANLMIKKRTTCNESSVKHEHKDLLLKGFIRCGYCKSRLYVSGTLNKKKVKTADTVHQYSYAYRCPTKERKGDCKGQITYGHMKTEKAVLEEIFNYFDQLDSKDIQKKIKFISTKIIENRSHEEERLNRTIQKLKNELNHLNDEIMNCLMSNSRFTPQQLLTVTNEKDKELNQCLFEKERLYEKIKSSQSKMKKIEKLRNVTFDWKIEFQNAAPEEQRNLLESIIDEVYIYEDKLDIHFKIGVLWQHNI